MTALESKRRAMSARERSRHLAYRNPMARPARDLAHEGLLGSLGQRRVTAFRSQGARTGLSLFGARSSTTAIDDEVRTGLSDWSLPSR
jgi:hypothetical protein